MPNEPPGEVSLPDKLFLCEDVAILAGDARSEEDSYHYNSVLRMFNIF